MISDKTNETDLLVGPTVHERYDLCLFTSEVRKTHRDQIKIYNRYTSPFRMYFGTYVNVRPSSLE